MEWDFAIWDSSIAEFKIELIGEFMNLIENPVNLRRAQALFHDLNEIDLSPELAVVGKELNLDVADLPALGQEFRRFLAVAAVVKDAMPSTLLDSVWHQAIETERFACLAQSHGPLPEHVECTPDDEWMEQTRQRVELVFSGSHRREFWVHAAGCAGK